MARKTLLGRDVVLPLGSTLYTREHEDGLFVPDSAEISGGSIIYAASASHTDVQAAIDSATSGATVIVPAGSSTWTSAVTVSGKYLHLQGAGGGRVEGISRTSRSIGTGSRAFTLLSGSTVSASGFTVGERVRARVPYNAGQWMEGEVLSYDGTTLTIDMDTTNGSGTYARWVFVVAGSTIITHSAGGGVMLSLTEHASGIVRLSGFHFTHGTGGDTGINSMVKINPATSGQPIQIHDNRFSTGNVVRALMVEIDRGTIYRNYFDAGFDWDNAANNLTPGYGIHVKFDGGSPAEGDPTWERAPTYGDDDTNGDGNVYIEQNFITGMMTETFDGSDNARAVIRYNVFDNSGLTSHGPDTANVGCRHFEVYNNRMVFDDIGTATANMNYWFYLRGGCLLFHNNTVDDISSSEWGAKTEVVLTVQNLGRNAGPYACWSAGYPAPHQVGQGHSGSAAQTEGCFIYSNTGTAVVGIDDYGPDAACVPADVSADYIQLNRDYFARAPQSGDVIHPYATKAYPHPARAG